MGGLCLYEAGESVLMPVLAVHLLVSNFLGRSRAHVHHFDDKAQGFATQRVINNKGVLKKTLKRGLFTSSNLGAVQPQPAPHIGMSIGTLKEHPNRIFYLAIMKPFILDFNIITIIIICTHQQIVILFEIHEV